VGGGGGEVSGTDRQQEEVCDAQHRTIQINSLLPPFPPLSLTTHTCTSFSAGVDMAAGCGLAGPLAGALGVVHLRWGEGGKRAWNEEFVRLG